MVSGKERVQLRTWSMYGSCGEEIDAVYLHRKKGEVRASGLAQRVPRGPLTPKKQHTPSEVFVVCWRESKDLHPSEKIFVRIVWIGKISGSRGKKKKKNRL